MAEALRKEAELQASLTPERRKFLAHLRFEVAAGRMTKDQALGIWLFGLDTRTLFDDPDATRPPGHVNGGPRQEGKGM